MIYTLKIYVVYHRNKYLISKLNYLGHQNLYRFTEIYAKNKQEFLHIQQKKEKKSRFQISKVISKNPK